MLYNIVLIVQTFSDIDIFMQESALRSKYSTVSYLNRNFRLMIHCFGLGVQTWICFIVLYLLDIAARDYHRLRSRNNVWVSIRLDSSLRGLLKRKSAVRDVPMETIDGENWSAEAQVHGK
jgi:hypothetical protein